MVFESKQEAQMVVELCDFALFKIEEEETGLSKQDMRLYTSTISLRNNAESYISEES